MKAYAIMKGKKIARNEEMLLIFTNSYSATGELLEGNKERVAKVTIEEEEKE